MVAASQVHESQDPEHGEAKPDQKEGGGDDKVEEQLCSDIEYA